MDRTLVTAWGPSREQQGTAAGACTVSTSQNRARTTDFTALEVYKTPARFVWTVLGSRQQAAETPARLAVVAVQDINTCRAVVQVRAGRRAGGLAGIDKYG